MANTMRILKKVEAPRPLKSQMLAKQIPQESTTVTADSLITIAESIASTLVTKVPDTGMHTKLTWLSQQLHIHGPRIEINYRDSLNKIFVIFRNESQNGDINYNIRLALLQLIELRANNWQSSEGANTYYKTKAPLIQESAPVEALVLSPSPEPFANPTPAQLLLAPGEVVRTSGKYNRPTKIPGKNYSKDEVVIRNADSGKVMGIKGRRVHMIEELSETIISFQRVNPGAKERLVQITGPSEERINYAKQLIEDTIRRNASPVRSMEQLGISGLSGGGDCDQDTDSVGSVCAEDSRPHRLRHSKSVNDANLEEYKYTVNVGNEVVKITGTSLHHVTAAKLELEKYFASQNFRSTLDRNVSDEENVEEFSSPSPLFDEIAVGFGNGFAPIKESRASPEVVSPRPIIERRKFFNRKSSEIKEDTSGNVITYSAKTLIDYSQLGLSALPPRDLNSITKNNIYKKQVNAVTRTHSVTNRVQENNNFIRQHFFSSSPNNQLQAINNQLQSAIHQVESTNNQLQNTNNNYTNTCFGNGNKFFCVRQYNGNNNYR